MKLEFAGFNGDEDAQYALWNKQLKDREKARIALEGNEYDDAEYNYDEWN